MCRGQDDGFDLFFVSSTSEVDDYPIQFTDPLPKWLRGTLIRNGLGRFEIGKRNFTHTFDGFAKLHSWKFVGNGSASFSAKFLYSDFYRDSVSRNDIAPYLLFQTVTPAFNEFQKLESLVRGIDNMNVNVYQFKNESTSEYFVFSDYWKMYEINGINLATKRSVTPPVPAPSIGTKWHPAAPPMGGGFGFLSFLSSAHPLPEYGTSNFLTFLSSISLVPGIKNRMSLIRIISGEKREAIASWEVDRVAYMHSFSATQNYAALFAMPFYVNVEKMVLTAEPFDSLDWYDNANTTIYLVHLKTGHVTKHTTENLFTMHHITSTPSKQTPLRSSSICPHLELKILRDPVRRNQFPAHALLKRFYIDLVTGNVDVTLFNASPVYPYANMLDMPAINEKYRYKDYRHIYGLVLKTNDVNLDQIALVKKDLYNSSNDKAWSEGHCYPVEAWFVPRPGGQKEDDGLLLVPVLDGIHRKSYLAIINATTMATVNTADLPFVIPYGLHGRFFADLF
ncbi:hypothetical protein ScPMuIL_016930 [Solemya velum]